MEIELKNYPYIKEYITNWVKNYPDRCTLEWMTIVSNALQCPTIVVLIFFRELVGESEEINAAINNLTEFYQYTKIK